MVSGLYHGQLSVIFFVGLLLCGLIIWLTTQGYIWNVILYLSFVCAGHVNVKHVLLVCMAVVKLEYLIVLFASFCIIINTLEIYSLFDEQGCCFKKVCTVNIFSKCKSKDKKLFLVIKCILKTLTTHAWLACLLFLAQCCIWMCMQKPLGSLLCVISFVHNKVHLHPMRICLAEE